MYSTNVQSPYRRELRLCDLLHWWLLLAAVSVFQNHDEIITYHG